MKILFAFDNPEFALNPYVNTLIMGLKKIDNSLDIHSSIAEFWNTAIRYDIIHIMWPDMLLKANGKKKFNATELENRLRELKNNGSCIVSTCHNLGPHYNSDKDYILAYNLVYKNSSIIFHLGEYSLSLFNKQYPASRNVYVPHHIYDTIYTKIPSHSEAQKKLHLSSKYQYILCFGMFRSDDERNMIIELSKKLKGKNIKILAPTFSYVAKRKNMFAESTRLLKYIKYSVKYPNIIKKIGLVSNEMLPYFCKSCDIALIQRTQILNSGNLPLNFYFGNVVIGPNVGNVGAILQEMHNPTFDINDINTSLYSAVMKGLQLVQMNMGEENKKYALRHFSTDTICNKLLIYYNEITK